MLRFKRYFLIGLTVAALAAVSGCAETELVVHAAKQVGQPPAPAEGAAGYKVGAPYQVAGVWYYPKADYAYRETGIASWYGPGFHGRFTANGETYDQNALTGAHRTLPMPSIVRVTNLENGRSVKVRINDRGPFKNGRIIDLSRRAADLLGFTERGTAKVRVEIVEDESRRLAAAALSQEAAENAPEPAPMVPVESRPLSAEGSLVEPTEASNPAASQTAAVPAVAPPPEQAAAPVVAIARPEVPAPDGQVTTVPVTPSRIYVQAGAFTRFDNANRLRAELSGLGSAKISAVMVEDRQFFRVRFGPIGSVEDADRLLDLLIANGHDDARVVVD